VKVGGILAIFFIYASGYFLISHYFYHYLNQLLEFYAYYPLFFVGRDKSRPTRTKNKQHAIV